MIRNFLRGIGSLVSIFPNAADMPPRPRYYKPAKTVEEAFSADWQRIGGDMDKAMKSFFNGYK